MGNLSHVTLLLCALSRNTHSRHEHATILIFIYMYSWNSPHDVKAALFLTPLQVTQDRATASRARRFFTTIDAGRAALIMHEASGTGFAVYMRGETSKARFFHERDIPPRRRDRDRFLMCIMGSPERTQIDGVGSTYPVTSKVAIVRPSGRENANMDFICAEVFVNESFVDYDAGCGNILAGVGSFAINEGLIRKRRLTYMAKGYTTQEVRIHQPLST